jgi:DNA-binding LytR/AlgR family response regulator
LSPLRVAVIEDEPLARERLSRLLVELGCEVVAELEDAGSLLTWLEGSPVVDGLFLDIQMPGGSGLEALAEMKQSVPVIFVTAFAEHAVRAFDAEAVDYVLKPVFKDRLERSLTRLQSRLVQPRSGSDIKSLLAAPGPRLLVKAGVGNVFLDLKKVTHFEVKDEVVWAFSGGKKLRTQWTALSEVESAFPDIAMMRIQRNTLLRPEVVLGYRSLPGGRWKVRLPEGVELEVSRAMTPKLREMLAAD